jgi:hypothetical protein
MRNILVFIIISISVLMTGACAKDAMKRVDPREALIEYGAHDQNYIKKVAATHSGEAWLGDHAALSDHYFNTFIDALRNQSASSRILIPGDAGFPEFAVSWDAKYQDSMDWDTSRTARANGFNGLISTSLLDFRLDDEKTGVWFWRRTKYYMIIVGNLDILDPITAAKSLSVVLEKKARIEKSEFENAKAGQWEAVSPLTGVLEELAANFADLAADNLQALRWQTSVTDVEDDRITLAAGRLHNLAPGDRLAVFEARQTISGPQGQTYIAPGFKLADIRIIDVNEGSSTAAIEAGEPIQAGDVAVPR